MLDQLPIAQALWTATITALSTIVIVSVKAYARHRLVKISLKNVKQEHRAEVLRAIAVLMEERRWWQRKDRDLRALLLELTSPPTEAVAVPPKKKGQKVETSR